MFVGCTLDIAVRTCHMVKNDHCWFCQIQLWGPRLLLWSGQASGHQVHDLGRQEKADARGRGEYQNQQSCLPPFMYLYLMALRLVYLALDVCLPSTIEPRLLSFPNLKEKVHAGLP